MSVVKQVTKEHDIVPFVVSICMCVCLCVKCVANVEKFRESTENPFLKKKHENKICLGKGRKR